MGWVGASQGIAWGLTCPAGLDWTDWSSGEMEKDWVKISFKMEGKTSTVEYEAVTLGYEGLLSYLQYFHSGIKKELNFRQTNTSDSNSPLACPDQSYCP